MKLLIAVSIWIISLSVSASSEISDDLSVDVNSIVALNAQQSGITFESNSDQYQLIAGGRAFKLRTPKVPANLAQSLKGSLWKASNGGFNLFIDDHNMPQHSPLSFSNTSLYNQIAYNPRTGAVAVVTGQIICAYNLDYDAKYISDRFGIALVADFPHLNTAFYTVNPWQDLFLITKNLNQSGLVKSAEVEVIENFVGAN